MEVSATVAMGALIRILTARLGEVAGVREARKARRAVGDEGLAAYVERLASETPR
jgi:hypothetical protein